MTTGDSDSKPQNPRKTFVIPLLLLIAFIGFASWVSVPRLMAGLRIQREIAAINSLRHIHNIEIKFKKMNLKFAALEELAGVESINPGLARGARSQAIYFRLPA